MLSNTQRAFSGISPDSGFFFDLDAHVLKAAARPGATLASVSGEACGAFPSLIAKRLERYDVRLKAESERDQASPQPSGPELHAAEFEWYFTEACAAELAGFLKPRFGTALIMGGPTVAAAMRRSGTTPTAVDRSPYLAERFGSGISEQHLHDLRAPLGFLRSHGLVFFDAPWHEDHISRWLWQASYAVSRRGTIAFALFGERTRPTARAERARLLDKASAIGRVSVLEDALHYDTPLFEAKALATAGCGIRSPWRRGDFVLIEDARSPIAPPPVPDERPWRTVLNGTRVTKLLPGHALPTASPDEAAFRTLDTVSRSRIREIAIGAWTSRNEIAPIAQRNSKSTPRRDSLRPV